MNVKQFVGNNIQRWREFKGIKQDDLAGNLNITKTTLSNIETGKAAVTVSRLEEIAKHLKVEITQLFSSPQQMFNLSNNNHIMNGYTQTLMHPDKNIIESYNAQLHAKDRQIEQLLILLKEK